MADFEGRGSDNQPRPSMKCDNCKKKGFVYYTGSSVEHGNPYTPAADTEVDHHYECDNCGNHWVLGSYR